MAGAADRCIIPEHPFDMERLAELMVYDRNRHPSRYSVVLVSEGARMEHQEDMSYEGEEAGPVRASQAGRAGDTISVQLQQLSVKYNNGRRVNVVNQRLGYLVRSGDPDALDSIVPMAFGNLALDLILQRQFGRLVSVHNGRYDSVPIGVVTGTKKHVDVQKYYSTVAAAADLRLQEQAALHHDERSRGSRLSQVRVRRAGAPGAETRRALYFAATIRSGGFHDSCDATRAPDVHAVRSFRQRAGCRPGGGFDPDTIRAGRFDMGKMWPFEYAPLQYFSETYGFDADAKWLRRARLAVLRVPGCSASFVSPDGLVVTNHHCVRNAITQITAAGESLLDDGFFARDLAAERRIPNYYADQLIAIEDVSAEVFAATDPVTADAERQRVRRATLDRIEQRLRQQHAGGFAIHVQIIPLYQGGRYSAYVFRRFTDVRMVAAAELLLGFFGGDPDNFTYPRYALDFAFLRVYDEGASRTARSSTSRGARPAWRRVMPSSSSATRVRRAASPPWRSSSSSVMSCCRRRSRCSAAGWRRCTRSTMRTRPAARR
jgi:hypothetical protein